MKRLSFDKLGLALIGLGFWCLLVALIYEHDRNNEWIDIDSIHNPINYEYVVETAFNNGNIPIDSVTQAMFNERYCDGNTPAQLHDIYVNRFGNK
jgi:hypothetical protein